MLFEGDRDGNLELKVRISIRERMVRKDSVPIGILPIIFQRP